MAAGVERDTGQDEGHAEQRRQVGELLIGGMAGVLVDWLARLQEESGRKRDRHHRQAKVDEPGHAFELVQPIPYRVYHEHGLGIHPRRPEVNSYGSRH